jgi:glycine oxidase
MDAKGIAMLEPALAGSHSKGVYLPQEAHLEPEKAMTALFSRFVATGGRFQLGEADPDSLIGTFGRVIDCRGYIPGHEPDLRAIQGEIITLHQPQLCLSRPVRVLGGPSPFYIVPRSGFEFAVGATAIANADETDWRMRVSSALSLLAFVTEIVPALKRARIVALNSGFRAAYPHLLPEVRQRQEGRIIQINGLYRHGYLLSPVLALCVVEMLRGETHEFMRLFDGRLNIPAVHFEEGSGNMGRG